MFHICRVLALAIFPVAAQASPIDGYATCLRTFTNFSAYLGYADSTGYKVPPRLEASYHADFTDFITTGLERFGEKTVRLLGEEASEPDEAHIKQVVEWHYKDGPETAFKRIAEAVFPCAEQNGNLKAYFEANP